MLRPQNPPDTEERRADDRRRWYALAVLCTAFFMGVLDSTSVYAALPSIGRELDLDATTAQWVASGYAVAVGGLLLLGGRAADLLGRRRVFLVGVAVFAGASLLAGLARTGPVLIGARGLQGLGAAVMTPAGLAILTTTFEAGAERNRALGIWGGLGGIGATAGLLIGGPITDVLGWEWVFLTNVPVCAVVLVVGPKLLDESHDRRPERRFDVPGAVTSTSGLVLLLAAIVTVPEAGWVTFRTAALLVGALVAFGLFVAVERRSPAPLVPLSVFRSRTLLGGNLVVLSAGMAVDGLLLLTTLYAQEILGYSATRFGLTMAVMTVASVLGVTVGQRLVTRAGFQVVAVAGMATIAVACLWLSRLGPEGDASNLLVGLLVFGPGMGAAFVAAQIAALADVAPDEAGLASGLEESSFAIGTALGVAIVAAVVAARTDDLLAAGAEPVVARSGAVSAALLTAMAFAVLGALAAWSLLGTRRS